MAKPTVLVLGGLGFIGRNFVQYLVENDLSSKIRVVDKTMLAMARLGKSHSAAFAKGVDVVQIKLNSAAAVSKAFGGVKFDVVVNLAGETTAALDDKSYEEGITDVSVLCGTEAAKVGCGVFIEISDARVYEPTSKSKDESGTLKPATKTAKAHLEAEKKLQAISGLNLIVLRPALVYGDADVHGLAPRIVFGVLCKSSGEQMPLPGWVLSMKCNTVNVDDLSAAIWHVSQNCKPGDVFNVADSYDSDLRKINSLIADIFGIKIDEMGSAKSLATKALSAKTICTEVNGDLVPKWGSLIKGKCDYSPLTPYLEEELLENYHLCVSGDALTKTGFNYKHPKITSDIIKNQIDEYVADGWLPKV